MDSGHVLEDTCIEYRATAFVDSNWYPPFAQVRNHASTIASVVRSPDTAPIETEKTDVIVDVAVGQPSDLQTCVYI